MNQEKVSKFITECRKEKGYTQDQIGEELKVTRKAVSKWERGICMPDVSLWIPLCKILEISPEELLKGERITSKSKKDNRESLIISLGYFLKRSKNQTKILIMVLTFLLIIILGMLISFYINNYNSVKIYTITSKNKDYKVSGIVNILNDRNLFLIYEIKSTDDDNDIYGIQYSLISEGTTLYQVGNIYDIEYDSNSELLSLNNELNRAIIFVKETIQDEFLAFTDINKKTLSLEIRYLDRNGEIIIRNINLQFAKEFSNNKLSYAK